VPKITKPNVFREKLLNLLSFKKLAHKILIKLTPAPQLTYNNTWHFSDLAPPPLPPSGVNFINALQAAFEHEEPESVKNTVKSSVSFSIMGSALVKAAHSTLMKLTPGGICDLL
jgi:hypothetical protein